MPSNKLLPGALLPGMGARGDFCELRLEEDDCLGGGCSNKEVTLSRRERFDASEEKADVGTVSRNLKTPFDGGAIAWSSAVPDALLLLTGRLDCLPSSTNRASSVS